MIHIIGLGAGDVSQMQVMIREYLHKKMPIYLRTEKHPAVEYLDMNNIEYHTYDHFYETCDTFDGVYEMIINDLLSKQEDIIYAVPGHPCVAEYTVMKLMESKNAKIIGGQSFLDVVFSKLVIDPIDGLIIMDALNMDVECLNSKMNLIIPQIYDQMSASNVKLDLMEVYPDEYSVYLMIELGMESERIIEKKLYELDHDFQTNNLSTLFVPKINKG